MLAVIYLDIIVSINLQIMATTAIKKIVSKQKIRWEGEGFNLDLCYVTERVIAMGFPSQHMESMYRNSLDDVRRFLESRHGGHYKIYNLCSEKSYDIRKFHSRVAVFPFDDHSPPEFSLLRPFCEDMSRWLAEDSANIAAVHCKAGKGRTGLMICAYLLFTGVFHSAESVLDFYASKRTFDSSGVTLPSQRRYVDYFATKLHHELEYSPVKLLLVSILLQPPPNVGFGHNEAHIQIQIHQTLAPHYESQVFTVDLTRKSILLKLPQPLLLNGDVKISFYFDLLHLGCRPKLFPSKNVPNAKLCHFWINTFFMALGHSSPLAHSTVENGERDGMGSAINISTNNMFAALEDINNSSPDLLPKNNLKSPDLASENIRVKLTKKQIDVAAKDESGKFSGNFSVELVMQRWKSDTTPILFRKRGDSNKGLIRM